MARFVTAECNGALAPADGGRTRAPQLVGLTVSVLDTLHLHREVARHRSEDYKGDTRGLLKQRERARAAAEADCAERNARHEAFVSVMPSRPAYKEV